MNTEHVSQKVDRGLNSATQRAESAARTTGDTARQIVGQVSGMAEDLVGSASSFVSDAQSAAGDALEKAVEEGKRRMDQLEKEVKGAPLAAIGVAFLGGIVLASLLKRS